MAFMMYGNDHDDAWPTSLEYIRPYMDAETSAVAERARFRWDLRRFSAIAYPSDTVVAVLATESAFAVGFADGHVETHNRSGVRALMAKEPNKGFSIDD